MKVSVICVYNNKSVFENQLLKSLKKQNMQYELIAIDNSNNKFSSAASALNYGAQEASGDVLIFSHQDIYLKRSNELEFIATIIYNQKCGDIVGTQGVREPSKVYYTNITAGKIYDQTIINNYEEQLYEVSCVDEGFFGMKKNTWEKLKFNEELCDNWHLYCVEMCLHTRKTGGNVYVWPAQLHHFSMGTITLGYMRNLKKLCGVYRKDFKYIWTTCYKVRTNYAYIQLLYLAWVVNRFIRGKLA